MSKVQDVQSAEKPESPATAEQPSLFVPTETEILDIQVRLNEYVWEHGTKVLKKGLGTVAGGIFADVTDRMIEDSKRAFRDRIDANMRSKYLYWGPPKEEDSGNGVMHIWRTQCGQYKIARFGGAEPRFSVTTKIDAKGASERIIGLEKETKIASEKNDFKKLRDAFEFVDGYHSDKSGHQVESNAEARLIEAENLGLDTRFEKAKESMDVPEKIEDEPQKESIMDEADAKGDGRMWVTVEAMHRLLVGCGLAKKERVVDKWPIDRLNRYLGKKNKFDELVAQANKEPGESEAKLLDEIGKAFASGTKIQIGDGSEPESEENVSTKTKEKKEKKTKPEKAKSDKPKSEKKKTKASSKPSKNGKPRQGMSLLDAAIKVLTDSKKSLKPQEILAKVEAKGYWKSQAGKTPEATLRAAMNVEIAKKGKESRFVKDEEVRGAFLLKK